MIEQPIQDKRKKSITNFNVIRVSKSVIGMSKIKENEEKPFKIRAHTPNSPLKNEALLRNEYEYKQVRKSYISSDKNDITPIDDKYYKSVRNRYKTSIEMYQRINKNFNLDQSKSQVSSLSPCRQSIVDEKYAKKSNKNIDKTVKDLNHFGDSYYLNEEKLD